MRSIPSGKAILKKEKALCPFWKGLPCHTRCSFIDVLSCTPTGVSEINHLTLGYGTLSHRYTGYKTHQYQTQSDLPVLDHNSARTQEAYPFWTTMSVQFCMVLTGPQSAHTRKQVHLPVMDTIPVPKTTYRLWIQYSYSSRPTSYGHNTRTQDELPAMNTIPVLKTTYRYGYNTCTQADLQVMDTIRVLKTTYKLWIQVIKTTYPLWI